MATDGLTLYGQANHTIRDTTQFLSKRLFGTLPQELRKLKIMSQNGSASTLGIYAYNDEATGGYSSYSQPLVADAGQHVFSVTDDEYTVSDVRVISTPLFKLDGTPDDDRRVLVSYAKVATDGGVSKWIHNPTKNVVRVTLVGTTLTMVDVCTRKSFNQVVVGEEYEFDTSDTSLRGYGGLMFTKHSGSNIADLTGISRSCLALATNANGHNVGYRTELTALERAAYIQYNNDQQPSHTVTVNPATGEVTLHPVPCGVPGSSVSMCVTQAHLGSAHTLYGYSNDLSQKLSWRRPNHTLWML